MILKICLVPRLQISSSWSKSFLGSVHLCVQRVDDTYLTLNMCIMCEGIRVQYMKVLHCLLNFPETNNLTFTPTSCSNKPGVQRWKSKQGFNFSLRPRSDQLYPSVKKHTAPLFIWMGPMQMALAKKQIHSFCKTGGQSNTYKHTSLVLYIVWNFHPKRKNKIIGVVKSSVTQAGLSGSYFMSHRYDTPCTTQDCFSVWMAAYRD